MACPIQPAQLIESELQEDDLPWDVAHKAPEKRRRPGGRAKSAFKDIRRILARLREAPRTAVLLDCDGTLLPLRRHPSEVRVPAQVKEVLRRVVDNPKLFVAIVSGRRVRDLKTLLDVKRLRYFGLQGAEWDRGSARISPTTLAALRAAKQAARRNLQAWPGIWVEDKGLTFSVHHRQANQAARNAASVVLSGLVQRWGDTLHVLNGSRVWEVLPKEVAGKSSAVLRILRDLPPGTSAIYIGDDGTDEPAFKVLEGQITVRVGAPRATHARYYLRAPADVIRFLTKLEKELRK
jgi:trehalose 6-phosphate phosphatase